MRDLISREALINKLKEHKDFFVSAYGGFSLMPDSIKYRVEAALMPSSRSKES